MADGKVVFEIDADNSKYKKKMKTVKEEALTVTNGIGSAFGAMTDKINSSTDKMGDTITVPLRKMADDGEQQISKLSKLSVAAAAAISAAFVAMTKAVASAIGSAIKTGMTYNAQIETYEAAFTTMLGSAEKAADLMEQLKQKAAATPFELEDLAEATQLLLNYGFTQEEVMDKMSMLGDIAQGSSEKMTRIATAYGQMSSAGKVSLEDVKQMIEAGFNPLQEITESTGESMASLYKRIEKGTISVDEITAAMERATSQGGKYYKSMETQSKTLNGQLSTLKDNANSFLGAMTSGLAEVAKNDILPALNEELERLTRSVTSGKLKPSIDKLSAAFSDLAKKAIDAASKALPKLIDAFAWFVDNLDTIIGLVKTAVYTFSTFKTLNNVLNVLTSLQTAFKQTSSALTALTLMYTEAAFSNASFVATLSTGQIIIGVLTGKITLATAAQALWNKVISANPIGAIITAATALVGIIGTLTSIFGKNSEEMHKYTKRAEELTEATDDVVASVDSSSEAYKDNVSNVKDSAEASKKLVQRLKELESQTNKDAAAKTEMREIVADLNELMPNLGLAYDEVTDSLNMSTDAIYDNIEAVKEQALLESSLERYSELIMEQEEIQRQITQNQEEQNALMEELFSGNITNLMDWMEALGAVNSSMDELTEKQIQNADDLEYVDEAITTHSETVASLNDTLTATGDAQDRIIVGNYDITEAIAGTGIAAEEAQEKYNNYAEHAQNAFEQIEDTVELTASEMITNLEANQERISTWTTNLGILADRGLDSGLLQALRDLGPEAAVTVQNLVNATDTELANLNAAYKNGGDVAAQALLTELGAPEVINAGEKTVDEISSGMEESADKAEAAATTVITGVKNTLTEQINSQFPSVGYAVCQGLAQGIYNGQSLAINAAISVARSTISAAKRELDSHSPSKVFEEIGESEPQGLAKGVEKDTHVAEKAVREMASKTIKTATSQNIGSSIAGATSGLSYISAAPIQINLRGDVNMDGFAVGNIVLRNLDDVASFTLRGS